MLIDARTVPDGARFECDICLVGTGAAGLSIIQQFIGSDTKICVAESGGLELEPDTQALYQGDNVGLPYFALDACRLRQFGGTTNHWAGYCLPYTPEDFQAQPWLPHSGWPIGLEDVRPYIGRAAGLLGLPAAGWNVRHWEEQTGEAALAFDPGKLVDEVLVIKPVRMGEVLRQDVEQAPNVQVYLHGNAVEVETNADATHVTGVRVQTLAGNQLTLVGDLVVLALGGIENPRLLLLSNQVQKEGLANGHDLVGRYFSEHPVFRGGVVEPTSPGVPVGFYRKVWFDGGDYAIHPAVMLAPKVRQSERITPVILQLLPVRDAAYESDGAAVAAGAEK